MIPMVSTEEILRGEKEKRASSYSLLGSRDESGMRILWVKVGGLWPLNTGGRLRSFHILSELSKRHSVFLVTTHRPDENPHELAAALPQCEQVLSFPYAPSKQGSRGFLLSLLKSSFSSLPVDLWRWRVPAVQRQVRRLLETGEIDLCIADFLTAVPNVPADIPAPLLYFSHNVEYMIWKRLGEVETNALRRAALAVEWRKMRWQEIRACRRADLTMTVSTVDRDQLRARAEGANIQAIPTGVDTSFFTRRGEAEDCFRLVFTGSMDWHPNEDAILYFLDEILPSIRREIPDVALSVVGRNPSPLLRAEAERSGVAVTGTVEDVRPYVDEAAVYVVPLRVGGGTRLKIFEALSMGKAVVSTTVGAEGLPLIHGQHFLRADSPESFASAVVSLIRDSALRRRLGSAGHRLVEDHYSWPRVAREVEEMCLAVAARRAEHAPYEAIRVTK